MFYKGMSISGKNISRLVYGKLYEAKKKLGRDLTDAEVEEIFIRQRQPLPVVGKQYRKTNRQKAIEIAKGEGWKPLCFLACVYRIARGRNVTDEIIAEAENIFRNHLKNRGIRDKIKLYLTDKEDILRAYNRIVKLGWSLEKAVKTPVLSGGEKTTRSKYRLYFRGQPLVKWCRENHPELPKLYRQFVFFRRNLSGEMTEADAEATMQYLINKGEKKCH